MARVDVSPNKLRKNVGEQVDFVATPHGLGANLTYQWEVLNREKKIWEAVAGAISSTLTIATATEYHAGSYRVVVIDTAANNSYTSKRVSLTVVVWKEVKEHYLRWAAERGTGSVAVVIEDASGNDITEYLTQLGPGRFTALSVLLEANRSGNQVMHYDSVRKLFQFENFPEK